MTIYKYDIEKVEITKLDRGQYKPNYHCRNLVIIFTDTQKSRFLRKQFQLPNPCMKQKPIQVFDSLKNPQKLLKVYSLKRVFKISHDEILIRIQDLSILQIVVNDESFQDLLEYVNQTIYLGHLDPFTVGVKQIYFFFQSRNIAPSSLQTQILQFKEVPEDQVVHQTSIDEVIDFTILKDLFIRKFQRNQYQKMDNERILFASSIQITAYEIFFSPHNGVTIQQISQSNNIGLFGRQKYDIDGMEGHLIVDFLDTACLQYTAKNYVEEEYDSNIFCQAFLDFLLKDDVVSGKSLAYRRNSMMNTQILNEIKYAVI